MNIVERKINNLKPRYLDRFSELIKYHAQFKGGAQDEKYVKAKAFGSAYEFYIYAYFVGVDKMRTLEIDGAQASSFWEIENWKPRVVTNTLIASAIAECDFDLLKVENVDESGIRDEVNKLLNTIEKYANGGFEYISEQLHEDLDLIESDTLFIDFLNN